MASKEYNRILNTTMKSVLIKDFLKLQKEHTELNGKYIRAKILLTKAIAFNEQKTAEITELKKRIEFLTERLEVACDSNN